MQIRNISLLFLQTLTRQRRYHPEEHELDGRIHWSSRVWVSNIFRAYEYIFGRGFGIRAEVSTNVHFENGEKIVEVEIYTFEALLCQIEVLIREFLKSKLLPFRLVIIQTVANPNSQGKLSLPGVFLAIALDVGDNATAGSTSPQTYSHTCTGSNLLIAICGNVTTQGGAGSATAASYNSVAATKATDLDFKSSFGTDAYASIWLLSNPATGANTVSVSYTGGGNGGFGTTAISYSGAKQTSVADKTNTAGFSAGGAQTVSLTPIAANCWIVASSCQTVAGASITVPTHTSRSNFSIPGANTGTNAVQDTNGTVSGATSIGWTFSTGGFPSVSLVTASFAPAAAVSVPTYFDHTASISQPILDIGISIV